MKKIIHHLIAFLGICLFVTSCGDKKKTEAETTGSNASETTYKSSNKQLNITMLLDLSDRIEPSKYAANPSHAERDMAAVKEVVDIFREEMRAKGNFKMKGKIKVLFSPIPEDNEINAIAQKLNINTAQLKPTEKTELYKNIETDFMANLQKIYETTLKTQNYIGSDIWRFFKNDVQDLVIDKDPQYRNILVVITDGYLYHNDTKIKENNRYSYILPELIKANGLVDSNWKTKMEELDFGLLNPLKDHKLDQVEVLFLEVNPSKQSPYEEDVLNAVLDQWFKEMGVAKYSIYQTDIPQNTKTKISNFFKS